MNNVLNWINEIVWGLPTLLLIFLVGAHLTRRTGLVQVRLFGRAMKGFFSQFRKENGKEGTSSFRALCTALAATVGTGNIAGVAGAIAIGGPGAIFWMWISAFLGMAVKYAEATLAVRYREKNRVGEHVGGPMYMIRNGLGRGYGWLSTAYCVFGVIAAFGVGNATQINAVIVSVNAALETLGASPTAQGNLLMGAILAVLVGAMLLGGMRRIGETAELLVPFASLVYILFCLGVLVCCYDAIPDALYQICAGAFRPSALTGGALGSVFTVIRVGTARGIFTNEAGIGTASIAHAGAQVDHPAQQGLMGIVEVFLDTIVICTLTALVILCSGVPIPYGTDIGAELTAKAFASVYGGWFHILLALCMCCFAFATVLGWGFYGIRCAQFLFGERSWKVFAFIQTGIVLISAMLNTGTVWTLSEIVNGLMAIPNLTALILLSPELFRLTTEYKKAMGGKPMAKG